MIHRTLHPVWAPPVWYEIYYGKVIGLNVMHRTLQNYLFELLPSHRSYKAITAKDLSFQEEHLSQSSLCLLFSCSVYIFIHFTKKLPCPNLQWAMKLVLLLHYIWPSADLAIWGEWSLSLSFTLLKLISAEWHAALLTTNPSVGTCFPCLGIQVMVMIQESSVTPHGPTAPTNHMFNNSYC